jgi:UDP-galactopyranose mutase
MIYDYLIVGAGFAGSVLAERIATQLNKKVLLVEKRCHIGGNAFDEYDEHGILVHKYGPHIFHTNSKMVFEYLSHFTDWVFYEHKVLAKLDNELYPIPINRITLNKLYDLKLLNDEETKNYLDKVKEIKHPILNSEDIIVSQLGRDLYEKFFKHYTYKQWNLMPSQLSAQVCGRIPVRFNEDSRYFTDKYQFMPKNGYTKLFEKMIDNKNIEVVLSTDYKCILNDVNFNQLVYTGPIDYFFDHGFGKLPYRSIDFEWKHLSDIKAQETAQINYVEKEIKYTRVVEHKQLTGQKALGTTLSFEFAKSEGEPFYPIPTNENRELYLKYRKEADKLKSVIFCGRLAEYQYYNMDQVVANTLKIFKELRHA